MIRKCIVMKGTPRFARDFGTALLLLSCFSASASGQKPATSANASSAEVARVAQEYWQHLLKSESYVQVTEGARIDELPDFSERKTQADAAFARHILDEASRIKTDGLSHEDLLTLEMLRWQQRQDIGFAKHYWLNFQVTPWASEITVVQRIFAEHPLRNQAELDHYNGLLEKCPAFIAATLHHVQHQAKLGIVLPKVAQPIIDKFWSSYLKEPESSPFYPAKERLQSLDPEQARRFHEKTAEIIRSRINPQLRELLTYLDGPYAQKAPEAVGLGQYPGGKEYYRFLVKFVTTLEITPEEVHRIGLEAVEESERRMAELRQAVGFKGTREEFHEFLRTDPRFVVRSPGDVEARLRFYLNRIESKLDAYFLKRPKATYDLKRLDPALEASQFLGHYDPPTPNQPAGIYYYNGSSSKNTSLVFMGQLALHEILPGHYFQLALQMENKALPDFRRQPLHLAYTEGWADYCGWLGQEMGIFEDQYDLYGMLAGADMRKSVRLVVDTGMNYMGWSRARAVAYMRQHLLDSDAQIEAESLRVSVDYPAQGLAYKIGSQEFILLRQKAQKEADAKFDVRKFHSCVLDSGSMPLELLARHVDWCMGQKDEK